MSDDQQPPVGQAPPNAMDDILDKVDHALDPEEADRKMMGRLKHPFVRWVIGSLIALLFMLFATYFLSFILKIPLPESKLLETFMSTIVEIMKVLVPA
ncbi:MAG TPA: hypothetical protein VF905_12005 [Nitrospirota bacterium]